MTKLLVTLLISILISSSLGWWDAGHMITAQIAKNELLKKNPQLYKYIEDLTLFGGNQYQVVVNNFVASGSWADDIKTKGIDKYTNWHFYNQPYNVGSSTSSYQPPVDNNLMKALYKIEGILLDRQTFGKHTNKKSEIIKLFIHIISDLHQPLHTAGLVNSTLVNSDSGGNFFNISNDVSGKKLRNLHSFWDSSAGLLPTFPRTLPYSNEALEEIQKVSNQITQQFPRSSLLKEIDVNDYSQMVKESYSSAKLYTYGPLLSQARQTVRITKEYQLKTYEFIKKQLALSGYRLAGKLTKIFEPQLRMQNTLFSKKYIF